MTDPDHHRKQRELDQLLNDPAIPMRPDRVWALLEDLARHPTAAEPSDRKALSSTGSCRHQSR